MRRTISPSLSSVSSTSAPANACRRFQVHFWISERDYIFLRTFAQQEDEPMARVMRRLIRNLRSNAELNDAKAS